MKGYRFRFDRLLKTKQAIIDDIAAKTARAQKILLMETNKLRSLEERQAECLDELVSLQLGAIDAGEVRRCHRYLQQVGDAADKQAALIKEIELRVEMLRNMLIETEKEKKILEKLDEKEREEFLREFLRKEQAVLDEVGINKFVQRTARHYVQLPQQQA